MFVSVNILLLKTEDITSYLGYLEKNIENVNLYNYSHYLIDSCEANVCSWYIHIENGKIFTSSDISQYFYTCQNTWFDKIWYFENISWVLSWCEIKLNNSKNGNIIYNYKIK